jgi:hypothetical protein
MELKDIKIGMILTITGSNSGCCGSKCKDCFTTQPIKVIDFDMGYRDGRVVHCGTLKDIAPEKGTHCYFDPRDLSPLPWKERFVCQKE